MKTKILHLFFMILAVFMLPTIVNSQTSLPWFEGFEAIGPTKTFTTNQLLVNGSTVWNYDKTINGRLRFNAGAGFYKTGSAAATLDCETNGTISINYMIATLPLQAYAAAQDLTLSFSYAHHGEESHPNDRVWIRGSDTDPWVVIYDWYANKAAGGVYKTVSNLDIDAALSAAGQTPSATFQLRFGQEDNYGATTTTGSDGFSVDDITIDGTVPCPNNTGVYAFNFLPSCAGTVPVTLTLKNYGTTTLASTIINWKINNVLQTPVTYTGALLTAADTLLIIGNYTFIDGINYDIQAWTSLPNGVADCWPANDSLGQSFMTSLNGTFTIGGTNPDFTTIAAAAAALDANGVCGPVVFNIADGTYTEQVNINEIVGASSTNTITFKSASNDSSLVIITSSSSPVFKLNGADYIIVKDMSIVATATANYAINLTNGATHNTIESNIVEGVNSSSSSYRTINAQGSPNEYNTYRNNLIKGGYYGMYIYGNNSTTWQKGTIIDRNEITDYYLYGMYTYYTDSTQITNNYIHGNTHTYGYGLYTNYINNGFVISGNRIDQTSTSSSTCYGIRVYYGNYTSYNATPSAFGKVYNNMASITGGSGTQYGLYAYYGNGTEYYNNTFSVSSSNTGARALYQSNSSSATTNPIPEKFLNNIFVNTGAGYAAYYSTPAKVDSADYNNYYKSGTGANYVYWSSNKTDLAALQTASGRDANSVALDPGFTAMDDLHTASLAMSNLGTPISGITTDIDGDIRSTTTPDMGADEYTPPNNEIELVEWRSPLASITPSAAITIKVFVRNNGLLAQSNIPVKYSIDGGTTFVSEIIAGPLASLDTLEYTFTTSANMNTFGVYNLIAFSDNTGDENRANDTIFQQIVACANLTGNYTIGVGAGFDFASFSDAALVLNSCGITGPVVFTADTGTFNEQFTLNNIVGASVINTITIKGTGNGTILTYEPASIPGIITLDGAKYVTIDSLNIIVGANAGSGWGIHLWHQADSNTIQNCYIELNNPISSSMFGGIVASGSQTSATSNGNNANYLTVQNNHINGGYYGMALKGNGSSSSALSKGTKILNNILENYTYYGIYLYYHDAPQIIGNDLTGIYAAYYHIYMYYCDNDFIVTDNKIDYQYGYALRMYYADGTTTDRGLVANNMFYQHTRNSTAYGFYISSSKNMDIFNNTAAVTVGNTSGYPMYLNNSSATYSGFAVINNNFANMGAGYAAFINSNANLDSCNYNNYYRKSDGDLLRYQGYRADLAALKAAYAANNQNSISVDPVFIPNGGGHVKGVSFNDMGLHLASITTDIDGDTRSLTTPDIGADEYTPPANDLSIVELITPTDDICGDVAAPFEVVITNLGTNPQTNFPINLIGTGPSGSISLNTIIGSLASGVTDTIVIGSLNTTTAGTYNFQVYATLATDNIYYNDTLTDSVTTIPALAIPFLDDFSSSANDWQGGYSSTSGALKVNPFDTDSVINVFLNNKVGPIPANAYLTFDYRINDWNSSVATMLQGDSINILMSTDCGATMSTIYTIDSSNHTTSATMQHVIIPLTAFMNDEILLGFEYLWHGADNSHDYDVYFDNIGISVPPVVDLGADEAICIGDTAILDAGTYTYNADYKWFAIGSTDTLANTQMLYTDTAGTYYAKVTTAFGFMDYDTIMVTVNTLPTITLTTLADACANDTAFMIMGASPAGGDWSGMGVSNNYFTADTAGIGTHNLTYIYTDGNGCVNNDTTTQTVNTRPMVNLASDTSICSNNTFTLDAGNASASYLWNTGETTQTIVADTNGFGVGSTMYDVKVTDTNMCSNVDTIEITYEATPVSQLTDTSTICGQSADITLDAGSVTGNTYLWSNGATGSPITVNSTDLGGFTGTMSVEITNTTGCVTDDSTYVYFREIPVVDLGGDQTACINHVVTIDAGTGFTSYMWNTGATTQTITLDDNSFIVGNNMYMVEVYNDVNCNAKDSINLLVDACIGVDVAELANANINIYPNPTKGQFQIDVVGLENEEYNLDIYNSIGAVVYSDKVSNDGNIKQTWKLDFSTYAKGVYYVRLHSNGDIKVKRIIID